MDETEKLEAVKEDEKVTVNAASVPPKGIHFIVVPDNSESNPERHTVQDILELQKSLYEALDRVEQGWCWVFVGGEPCKLHMPRQVFVLELPSGAKLELRPAGEEPVSVDGRFYTLRPVQDTHPSSTSINNFG